MDYNKNNSKSVQHPQIFSAVSMPFGLSLGEWTAKWWQWILSIPKQDNPGNDIVGDNCCLKQEGPVWFLVGTFENIQSAERVCTIPKEKAILIPIIISEKSYAEFPELKNEISLRERARSAIDRVTKKTAIIDYVVLRNVERYRIQSPLFKLVLPQGNIYGAKPGPTQAVSDGYWVMLKPFLEPGKHEIQFGGEAHCQRDMLEFKTKVKYHLILV